MNAKIPLTLYLSESGPKGLVRESIQGLYSVIFLNRRLEETANNLLLHNSPFLPCNYVHRHAERFVKDIF